MDEKGVAAVIDLLNKVEQVAKDTPPVNNAASRFGNPAFRTFYDLVSEVRPVFSSIKDVTDGID